MKESLLDVLIYLFDRYVGEEFDVTPEQEDLRKQLIQAGFSDKQIDSAIFWLEDLAVQNEALNESVPRSKSVRLFNDVENEKLNIECRGFLLFLEQSSVIDVEERELIIDRVMALGMDVVELQQLKWVVLLVLFNRQGEDVALAWLGDEVADLGVVVH